jgi:hypothetical protein
MIDVTGAPEEANAIVSFISCNDRKTVLRDSHVCHLIEYTESKESRCDDMGAETGYKLKSRGALKENV